jgi:muramoyltetrapeptide carboxypeptidase
MTSQNSIALFCAASRPVDATDPERCADFNRERLQCDTVIGEDCRRYLDPKTRADILISYLKDDTIGALCALRGGEGSADLIPFLHAHHDVIKKLKPKPIVGFSDISALLIYFAETYGWPVIHGPGLIQLAKDSISETSQTALLSLLTEDKAADISLSALNQAAETCDPIEATLTGGNLSLINISIKDLWEIDTKNKIVILEDVNEKPHAIIRSLKYLHRIGKFKAAKAIILGDFIGDETVDWQADLNRYFSYFADLIDLPVYQTDQVGHGNINIAFSFNRLYRISRHAASFMLHRSQTE